MVPPEFTNFFLASAGAGAALIGLLFVAISIAPENTVMAGAPLERQAMATSAFTALINAFFFSIVALVPRTNIGYGAVILGLLALSSSLLLAWNLFRQRQHWQDTVRRTFLIIVSVTVYGYQLYNGVILFINPADANAIYALTMLVIGVYGVGLTRAWQLLGARYYGLTGWLSIMHEMNEKPPVTADQHSPAEDSLTRETHR
ncbi:MAG TPA: hypothetical protein VJ761_22100 [Ktedonobacteraceae bacterium]|nr:hypothetical protein [Ktedonobacteraceae bacterium]